MECVEGFNILGIPFFYNHINIDVMKKKQQKHTEIPFNRITFHYKSHVNHGFRICFMKSRLTELRFIEPLFIKTHWIKYIG